jgi:hypothetical protein
MTVSKLLMYGLDDSENYLFDFFFDINAVQGCFMADEEHISVVISGQIYELEYSSKLLEEVKNALKLKTLIC